MCRRSDTEQTAMGMDVIEIIMGLEDEFGITIPDADADVLRTAGALCRYVMRRVGARPRAVDADATRVAVSVGSVLPYESTTPGEDVWSDLDEQTWRRVAGVLGNVLRIPPEEIRPGSRLFEDLGAS